MSIYYGTYYVNIFTSPLLSGLADTNDRPWIEGMEALGFFNYGIMLWSKHVDQLIFCMIPGGFERHSKNIIRPNRYASRSGNR